MVGSAKVDFSINIPVWWCYHYLLLASPFLQPHIVLDAGPINIEEICRIQTLHTPEEVTEELVDVSLLTATLDLLMAFVFCKLKSLQQERKIIT